MTSLKALKINDIFFKQNPSKPLAIGLAVTKNEKGAILKKKLEEGLKKIDQKSILSEYFKYANMPEFGKFLIK